MVPRWVAYAVFAIAVIPVAVAAHLRGSITTNDLALASISLTVTIVMFSVYLFHRQAFLQDARNADMQALRQDLYSQPPASLVNARRAAGYFLIQSELLRRAARVRAYMALLLVYAIIAIVIALVISIAFPGSIYWLSPYFIGTYFFGCAIIARQQDLGFAHPVKFVEALTPSGLASVIRGSADLPHLMVPPRYALVVEQLDRSGWKTFLRQLQAADDPTALREPWPIDPPGS